MALRKATNLLYQVMHMVWYHCTAAAIKMAHKVGTFVVDVLFAVTLVAAGAIRSKESPDSSFEGPKGRQSLKVMQSSRKL